MMMPLVSDRKVKKLPNRSEAREVTGPMTQRVRQKVTVQVMRGIANSLMVSGIYLDYSFSNQAAKAMAQMMGMTLEV